MQKANHHFLIILLSFFFQLINLNGSANTQDSKIATLLWSNNKGSIEFLSKNNQWTALKLRDEISIKSKIQIKNKDVQVVIKIENRENIKINGPLAPTTVEDAYEFYKNNTQNQSNSLWNSILSMFDYSSDEGFGMVSGVTRGESILHDNENKLNFHFQTQINTLDNHDVLILWDKDNDNVSNEYKLQFSYTDFSTFSNTDSILVVNDTFLIVEAKDLINCIPCNIQLIDNNHKYGMSKIKIQKEKNIPIEVQLLDSLISLGIEVDLNRYAKSQWLIKNHYFENGLSLANLLVSENKKYSIEIKSLISKLMQSSNKN